MLSVLPVSINLNAVCLQDSLFHHVPEILIGFRSGELEGQFMRVRSNSMLSEAYFDELKSINFQYFRSVFEARFARIS